MKISSSTQDKNKVVTVNLTMGQCRLLESLVDAELCEAEAHPHNTAKTRYGRL